MKRISCIMNNDELRKLLLTPVSIEHKKQEELEIINQEYTEEEREGYNEQTWQCHDSQPEDINVQLEFVETNSQQRMFWYYRCITSSMPQYEIPGRAIKILVRDRFSGKYIGLIQLTVDLLQHPGKTQYLGIEPDKYGMYKKYLRDNGVNISICVPLQPFGYQMCGGKLLAMLCFTREVSQYYHTRYGRWLKYIATTSINGKSIQYSKLDELKYVGLTSGYGTGHLSKQAIEAARQRCKRKKESVINIVKTVTRQLNLDPEKILHHGQCRGVYIGFLSQECKNLINTRETSSHCLATCNTACVTAKWVQKYALKRQINLQKRKTTD